MTFFSSKKYNISSDEELMLYVSKGKEKAFDELYKRYAKKLLYFFFQKLNDEDKANDFLQDLFLKIIEHPNKFDETKKFSSWIYSIAHNMCKNEFRNEALHVSKNNFFKEKQENNVTPFFCEIDLKLFNAALHQELNKLEEIHKLTFELRYMHELTLNEIAEVTEVSLGTVKSRLFYTTKKLAKSLQFLITKV
ncbi:MAG: RNA polymerase subunit sigma-70 [Flavobacteriales bacterium CG_4_9_14_0_2_um_filter_32_27]|nr:MAG: RNA polymerase subunit sigma-70 [Flavobacteriales bacterium CG_4_9_14_0_2_um_filter_32_27]